jgi:hypothetical protein
VQQNRVRIRNKQKKKNPCAPGSKHRKYVSNNPKKRKENLGTETHKEKQINKKVCSPKNQEVKQKKQYPR